MTSARLPPVVQRFPDAPPAYDRGAEAQFRRLVQNALTTFQSQISVAPEFLIARAEVLGDESGDLVFEYRLNAPYGVAIAYAWSTTAFPTREEVLDGTHVNYAVRNSAEELEGFTVAAGVAPDEDDEVFFTAIPFAAWDADAATVDGEAGEEYQTHIRVAVDGGHVRAGTIIADKLTDQARRFTTDIVFSAVDQDTVQWTTGTLTLANGDSFSITGSNTGTMTGITFIYLDRTASTTQFQVSGNYANVASDDVILAAVAKPGPTTGQNAFFVPGVGVFGLNEEQLSPESISATKIQSDAVTTPKLVANAVTAAKITAGAVTTAKLDAAAVTTDKLAANSVTAAKISVVALSAIQADIGLIIAGAIENAAGTAGIFVDGSAALGGYSALPGAWTTYLNLDASGTAAVLKHPAFELLANGDATFSGDLSAVGGTFSGALQADTIELRESGGTVKGSIGTGTAGKITLASAGTNDLELSPGGDLVLAGFTASGTAGSIARYIEVVQSGTTYKIALYSVS